MTAVLKSSGIYADGFFLNPDTGFDTEEFRRYCSGTVIIGNINQNKRNGINRKYLFDDLLYKCRFVVKHTNAWFNAFKATLLRFETNEIYWKALNLLTITMISLRRL